MAVELEDSKEIDYKTGHRKRLMLKLFESHGAGFSNTDLVETLLFHVMPRHDVKPLAHRLINYYGSMGGMFASTKAELKNIDGIGEKLADYICNIGIVFNKLNEETIKHKEVFTHWDAIENYCCSLIGHSREERLLLVFLNRKLAVIHTEIVHEGTTEYISLNIRQIAKLAIYRGANHLILSHNHPSGDLNPSREDIESTKLLAQALKPLEVSILDHIIVSESSAVSLKNIGVLR